MKINIKIEIDGKVVENMEREVLDRVASNRVSQYARIFDSGCLGWSRNPECNLLFLKQQEANATAVLEKRGYLFLNDVYDMLGYPRTQQGQLVGWIYDEKDPIRDSFVDFGIYKDFIGNHNFVNGFENSILLDFNVDGVIFDKLE